MATSHAVRHAALLAIVLALTTHPVGAAEPLALDVRYAAADPSCPSLPDFLSRVREKIDLADPTDPRARRVVAAVTLHGTGSAFAGQLALQWPGESLYSRDLSAGTCEELAFALAFVLALALEDRRDREERVPPPPLAPAPPAAAPPVEALSPTDGAWKGSVAGYFGVRTGLSPTWTFAEVASLELRRRTESVFASTLRLGFVHAEPVTRIERAGQTRFTWIAARAEGCPARLRASAAIDFVPCAVLHVGSIGAAGTPSTAEGTGTDARGLWVDAALALRAAWRFVPAVSIEAQGDAIVPVTRHRFAFDNPDTTIYQIPIIAFAGYLGIGVHLP